MLAPNADACRRPNMHNFSSSIKQEFDFSLSCNIYWHVTATYVDTGSMVCETAINSQTAIYRMTIALLTYN